MNKSQLIDALAARYEGNRKAAAQALDSVLDTITREVAKGEKVAITGFGSFEKRVRDARWVRNPRTGERIKAKKTAVPKFSAGAELKAVVSGAKKLPKLALNNPAKSTTGAGKKTAAASKTTATKSTPAKKTTAKSTAKKTAPAKKTAAKSTAKKTAPAKKTATKSTAKKTAPAKKTATKSTAKKSTPAKKTTARKTAKKS
ncbi:MAG TPA: HU family DNA-binding protein [Marmoricola sp.]